MSRRPSAVGTSPRSGLNPNCADNSPRALILTWTRDTPAAAVAGQLLGRPPLRGLGQPRLSDRAERQLSAMAEDRQVPGVLGLLTAGIGQRPADIAGQRLEQRACVLGGQPIGRARGDRVCLFAPDPVTDRAQARRVELGSVADALL